MTTNQESNQWTAERFNQLAFLVEEAKLLPIVPREPI